MFPNKKIATAAVVWGRQHHPAMKGGPDVVPPWICFRLRVLVDSEDPNKSNFPTCKHKNGKVKIPFT